MIHTGEIYINPLTDFKPMELKAYEQSVYAYRDIKNGFDSAKRAGERLGLVKGRMLANVQTAKNLLKMGLPIDKIVKATGLSVEDVQNLQ